MKLPRDIGGKDLADLLRGTATRSRVRQGVTYGWPPLLVPACIA
jgi:hypothetical protein